MSCSSSGEIIPQNVDPPAAAAPTRAPRIAQRLSGSSLEEEVSDAANPNAGVTSIGAGPSAMHQHPFIPTASDTRFEKLHLLGQGNFGEAWLARSSISGRNYVVKEMKMTCGISHKDRERTFNEVTIIKKCCHVNIIRYKDCYITRSVSGGMVLGIVMEYADAGDLHNCIKKHREVKRMHIPEPQVRSWLVQLTFALQYLHKNSILHRDLKAQNIFMTRSGLLKLGDFGISKTLSHENDFATTGIGTPQYLSPEICQRQKYNHKSDIWGLGCVLYEMCALVPAFPGNDLQSLVTNIVNANYRPIPVQYSNVLSELVKVMLRPDPARRPSSEQILGAKVLSADVLNYMQYIKSLPDVLECGRKASSGSVSSLGSSGGVAEGAVGTGERGSGSGSQLSTLV